MKKLQIDVREVKIKEKINTISPSENKFEIEFTQLILGDFQIVSENSICIIERKTKSDLVSSIMDNRFREQKARLMKFKSENLNSTIIYIIEDGKYNIKYEKHIQSAILNMMFEYNINVILSKDINETIKYVYNLMEKDYTTKTDICEKNDYRPEKYSKNLNISTFVKMLCCINGISVNIANAIEASGINNMSILLDKLKNEEDEFLSIVIKDKKKVTKLMIQKLKDAFV